MSRSRTEEERREIVARFERGLSSLATLVEDSGSAPDAILRVAGLCQDAFRDVQALADAAGPDLERAKRLLAVAIDAVRTETEFTARRLKLATNAQRALRQSMAPPEVGESCDIAG